MTTFAVGVLLIFGLFGLLDLIHWRRSMSDKPTTVTAWFCPKCRLPPPPEELAVPEPYMHTVCGFTCMRMTVDPNATGGAPTPPVLPQRSDILREAAAEPATKAKPQTLK